MTRVVCSPAADRGAGAGADHLGRGRERGREAVAGAQPVRRESRRRGGAVGLAQRGGGQRQRRPLGVDEPVAVEAEIGRGGGGQGPAVEVEAARARRRPGDAVEAVDVEEPAGVGSGGRQRADADAVLEAAPGRDHEGVAAVGPGDMRAGRQPDPLRRDQCDPRGRDRGFDRDGAGARGRHRERPDRAVGGRGAARPPGREQEIRPGAEAELRCDERGDRAAQPDVAAVGEPAAGLDAAVPDLLRRLERQRCAATRRDPRGRGIGPVADHDHAGA